MEQEQERPKGGIPWRWLFVRKPILEICANKATVAATRSISTA